MRCPFFLSKNPFWNQKRTDISMYIQCIHIHIHIYIYIDRCFFLSCVGLSHPKYMFSGFLFHVVFQHHFIGKNVSNQKVFHWILQYR